MRRAFTLLEVVFAMGVMVMAILLILALTTTALRSNQKTMDLTSASLAAERELNRQIYLVQNDVYGEKDLFWDSDYLAPANPFKTGTTRIGATDFSWALYAQSLDNASLGVKLGTSNGNTDNRCKKVDIVVWWWGSETRARQGYGDLSVRGTRLVSEPQE